MAHIHAQIDFVVALFPVYKGRCALIHHKKLDMWLGMGGHIELDEVPDDALFREAFEESGLNFAVLDIIEPPHAERAYPPSESHNSRKLLTPWRIEVHDFPPIADHRHVCLVYFASARTDKLVLEADAHHEIRWFSKEDLARNTDIPASIRHYAEWAIEVV